MPANSGGGAVPGIGGLAGLAMGAAGMRRKREVVDTHQPAAMCEREVVDTHQPAARSQSVSAHSPFPRGRSFMRRLNLPAAGNSQAKSPQNTVL